jgi:hypothetical protein
MVVMAAMVAMWYCRPIPTSIPSSISALAACSGLNGEVRAVAGTRLAPVGLIA